MVTQIMHMSNLVANGQQQLKTTPAAPPVSQEQETEATMGPTENHKNGGSTSWNNCYHCIWGFWKTGKCPVLNATIQNSHWFWRFTLLSTRERTKQERILMCLSSQENSRWCSHHFSKKRSSLMARQVVILSTWPGIGPVCTDSQKLDYGWLEKSTWSDEAHFQMWHSDGRVGIWRKQHEIMDPSCLASTVQAGGGVMVWGTF